MLKSFDELKQTGLNYQQYETKRVEMLAKRKKGLMTAAIVGGAIAVIGLILMAIGSAGAGIGLIVLGVIVFVIWYAVVSSSAKSDLKNELLNDLLKNIDPSFAYQSKDRNLSTNFRKSGFVKNVSAVSVEDVFKGQISGLNFTLGEARVTRKSGENSSTTVYSGPFAYVETTNNYNFTSVIPDIFEKALGGLGHIMQKANLSRLNQKLIKIDEDPDFEKLYAVWTKDEQTIRQILSPQFRDYLKGIARKTPVFVGFRDNMIFFGLDNRKNLFGIKLKDQISETTMKRFYDEFSDYYTVLENVVLFATTGNGASNTSSSIAEDVPPPEPEQNNNDNPPNF